MNTQALIESYLCRPISEFGERHWILASHFKDLPVEFIMKYKNKLSFEIIGQKNENIDKLLTKCRDLPIEDRNALWNPKLSLSIALKMYPNSHWWHRFGETHKLSRGNLRKAGKNLKESALDGLWFGICGNSAYNFADLADEFTDNFKWKTLLTTSGLTIPENLPRNLEHLLSELDLKEVRMGPASLEILGKLQKIPGILPLNVGPYTKKMFANSVKTWKEFMKYRQYLDFGELYRKRKDFLFGPELAGLRDTFDWKDITRCRLLPEELIKYEDYIDWGSECIGHDNIPANLIAKHCNELHKDVLIGNLQKKAPLSYAQVAANLSKATEKEWLVISHCRDVPTWVITKYEDSVNWKHISRYHEKIEYMMEADLSLDWFEASFNPNVTLKYAIAFQAKLNILCYASHHRLNINDLRLVNKLLIGNNLYSFWEGISYSCLYDFAELAAEFKDYLNWEIILTNFRVKFPTPFKKMTIRLNNAQKMAIMREPGSISVINRINLDVLPNYDCRVRLSKTKGLTHKIVKKYWNCLNCDDLFENLGKEFMFSPELDDIAHKYDWKYIIECVDLTKEELRKYSKYIKSWERIKHTNHPPLDLLAEKPFDFRYDPGELRLFD